MAPFFDARFPLVTQDDAGASVDSFHARLLDSLHDGVYFVDADRRITYWNKGAEHLTGYTAEEAVGSHCYDNLLMHVDEAGCILCKRGCPLSRTMSDGERREAEVFLRHKRGHRIPVSVRAAPLEDSNGAIVGAVEVFSDISAKKNLERQAGELEGLAYSDALTGLVNRRYIDLKVRQAIQEGEHFHRAYGLILIDVDQFKQVNDRFGHAMGDRVLKAICDTLSHGIRPGDTAGRWGGDELLVVARDVTAASLEHLAERCRKLIAETSVPAEHGRLRASVSMGATLLCRGDTCESAVNRADQLLYASKSAGRNQSRLG